MSTIIEGTPGLFKTRKLKYIVSSVLYGLCFSPCLLLCLDFLPWLPRTPKVKVSSPLPPKLVSVSVLSKPQRPNLGAQGTTTQGTRRAKTLFLAEHGGGRPLGD